MKVGLMLALGEDDGLGRTLTWPELRDMALAAEASGLDSVELGRAAEVARSGSAAG